MSAVAEVAPIEFRTTAMAEGAIDGIGADYELPAPFAVNAFRYGRFMRQQSFASTAPSHSRRPGHYSAVAGGDSDDDYDNDIVANKRVRDCAASRRTYWTSPCIRVFV